MPDTCSHLDDVDRAATPVLRGLRGLPAHRRSLGAPADVPRLRARRLLRLLTQQARDAHTSPPSATRWSRRSSPARTGGGATRTSSASWWPTSRRTRTRDRARPSPRPDRPDRPVLLTVDDDPSVSRAVARDLRRQYGEHHRVVRASSGAEALEALRELKLRGEQVAVLLADYRMPEMSGIEFLESAMDLFPRARRALLTAYADTDAAIAAINVVDVDHYLLKPWEPPEEKLYPVVDAMLDAYLAAGDAEVRETKVVGPPLVRPVVRGARLPGPQRGARTAGSSSTSRRGNGCWQPPASAPDRLPLVVTPEGETLVAPDHDRGGRRRRACRPRRRPTSTTSSSSAADRPVSAPRSTARRRGLRTLLVERRGDRRAGRPVVPDRELPRLPRRRLRRPAHRPGPPAGRQVRRRDPHGPRRHRAAHQRAGAGGAVRRRHRGRGARRHHRHRRLLPGPRRSRRQRAQRQRLSTTAPPRPRRPTASTPTSTSSAAPTRPARRRCSSPGWPSR